MEDSSFSSNSEETAGLNNRDESFVRNHELSAESRTSAAEADQGSKSQKSRFQNIPFRIHGWPGLGRRSVEQRHRHLHRRQASDSIAGPAMPNVVDAIAMMSVGLDADGNGSLVQVSTVSTPSLEAPTALPTISSIPTAVSSIPPLLSSQSEASSSQASSSSTHSKASQTSAMSTTTPSTTSSASSSKPTYISSSRPVVSSFSSSQSSILSSSFSSSSSSSYSSSSSSEISSSKTSSSANSSTETSGTPSSSITFAPTQTSATGTSASPITSNSTATALRSSTQNTSLQSDSASAQVFSGNSTSSAIRSTSSTSLSGSTHLSSTSSGPTTLSSSTSSRSSSSSPSKTKTSTPKTHESSTSTTSSANSSSSSFVAASTTLDSSPSTTSAATYVGQTNTGASATSAVSTISTSASASSSTAANNSQQSNGSNMTAPMPAVVGGVVGGIAGLAILFVITLLLLRWKKQKNRALDSVSGGGTDYGASRETIEPTGLSGGGMVQRSSHTPLAAAAAFGTNGLLKLLRPLSQQTATTTETAPSQRGFEKISGRKLPSIFSPGAGDGFPTSSRETFAGSSIYGEEPGFYGTGGATESPYVDTGAFEHQVHPPANWMAEEVAMMRPSPGRSPVPHQGAGFATPSPRTSPVPKRPLPPDGLGRSHPSHDGSRSSRFTENIT
ncbi:hypothetical protein L228DRAFT_266507 [Xylona heveae TC161]|uniref:REJ domain-containing protein n=1 Tax=Xylona heveae (strain CBS 132557 / TC161) TaxID=1328760 RepID=A0A165HZN8_XYLHT|nr:hypothetical protein L228DRAFT_266507 [Xylona heveae TC161]KZF24145.1 hypothetical protein L228DRAFT_266507 [Xylona heveae TC161]